MKSIVLCEGPDDLWFILYYLYKVAGWSNKGNPQKLWKSFRIKEIDSHQQVQYLQKDGNGVAVWSVGGKDCFQKPIEEIIDTFVKEIPSDAISSIVVVRDRDHDELEDVLHTVETWFPGLGSLKNKESSRYTVIAEDGEEVSTKVTPVIIPFEEPGAIETLLMNAIKEKAECGVCVTQSASEYISSLLEKEDVCKAYFSHERLILKAKYAAMIAVTNPDHSTGLFQDMVLSCPWETSPYVQEHFGIILNAISPGM